MPRITPGRRSQGRLWTCMRGWWKKAGREASCLLFHLYIKDQLTFQIFRAHFEFVFELVQHSRKLLVTIRARVEARVDLIDGVAHYVQPCPTILSDCHFERLA